MLGGAVFGNFYWRSPSLQKIISTWLPTVPAAIINRDLTLAWTPERQFVDKPHVINVLIMGCDADYEPHNWRPVVIKGAQTRSDAILMAQVDFDRRTIHALTIPRDTAVRIPGRKGIHKINAAHMFGGPALAKETIRSVFGIDTDYYVTLDFDGFKKVVDAIGGVDLTIHRNMDYDDNWGNLHIHLRPGYQHLTGNQAMGYVRFRHGDNDLMRSERQHEFLESVRGKVKNPSTLMKLPDVLNAISDSIKSDMSQDQLLTLVNFARQLPKESIEVATLPSIEGPSFVYVRVAESAEVIRRLFFDNNLLAVNINAPDRSEVPDWEGQETDRWRSRRPHKAAQEVETFTPRYEDSSPLAPAPDASSTDGANAPLDRGNPDAGTGDNDATRPARPDAGSAGDNRSGNDSGGDSGGKSDRSKGDGPDRKENGSGTGSGDSGRQTGEFSS
jgi:LCP family protein required for cell wall assembly